MSITIHDSVNNMQVMAERFTGKLEEHRAIAESIQVIRDFVSQHYTESSAGGMETLSSDSIEIALEKSVKSSKKPRKSRTKGRSN